MLQEEKITFGNKVKQLDAELVEKKFQLKTENGKVIELRREKEQLAEMLKVIIIHYKKTYLHNLHFQEEKVAYKLKFKQSEAQFAKMSSQLRLKHDEVVKLQKDNEASIQIIQMQKVKIIL